MWMQTYREPTVLRWQSRGALSRGAAVVDGRRWLKLKRMSKSIPSLFISHGAPDIILSKHPAVDALRALPARFPQPTAIVIVSAHWIDDPIGVTAGGKLASIHDFGGFADELYALQYPASGDAAVSHRILQRLQEQGMQAEIHERRGLDHGAWIPLKLMFPEADVPVIQISLPAASLEEVVRLGKALSPLRVDGVLIIGSGGSVHNLRALKLDGGTDDWVLNFEDWLLETIEGNRFSDLITPAKLPGIFRRAHPTIEHYAPLVFAWSAADAENKGSRYHHSVSYGNLGMSMYLFG
jgi:4,5-DOPA dioxygenase extradiol